MGEGRGDWALSDELVVDEVFVGEVVFQPKKAPNFPGDLGLEVEDESNDSSEWLEIRRASASSCSLRCVGLEEG